MPNKAGLVQGAKGPDVPKHRQGPNLMVLLVGSAEARRTRSAARRSTVFPSSWTRTAKATRKSRRRCFCPEPQRERERERDSERERERESEKYK